VIVASGAALWFYFKVGFRPASKFYGQATKGGRWMPWHIEAMKDVASCDKPRRGASTR
jgi:hypothetical protein